MNYSCLACNLTFLKPNKYAKHLADSHGTSLTFSCTRCCSYEGPSYRALTAHRLECKVGINAVENSASTSNTHTVQSKYVNKLTIKKIDNFLVEFVH